MLFVVSIIDTVFIVSQVYTIIKFPVLPYFTAIGTVFLCIIELKSIYESSDEKNKARFVQAGHLASEIVANKENAKAVIAALGDYLKNENTNKTDNELK